MRKWKSASATVRPPADAAGARAPLLGWKGALLALALSLLLCWPIWLGGGTVLVIDDTRTYLRAGEAIYQQFLALFGDAGQPAHQAGAGAVPAGAEPPAGGDDQDAKVARSLAYPLAFYPVQQLLGASAFAIVQGWIAIYMALALVSRAALARPAPLILLLAFLAILTPLPRVTVFLVPDLLAAVPILFAVVVATKWDVLTVWQRLVLGALAAFAAASHYGTVPLAGAVLAAALVIRWWWTKRIEASAIIAALCVTAFGPALNLAASTAAMDRPSTTPLRLPILLARSIEDGPARWYLEEACPDAPLALCEVLGDDIPDDVGEFLWTDSGIAAVTADQMDRIREEEPRVLWRAFLAYPVEQAVSLAGNAGRQLTILRMARSVEAAAGIDAQLEPYASERSTWMQSLLVDTEPLIIIASWLALLALAALAFSRGLPPAAWISLAVAALGLLANAMVFGGLSAPVGRYQARVIWIPILLLALAVIEQESARSRSTKTALSNRAGE